MIDVDIPRRDQQENDSQSHLDNCLSAERLLPRKAIESERGRQAIACDSSYGCRSLKDGHVAGLVLCRRIGIDVQLPVYRVVDLAKTAQEPGKAKVIILRQ